MMESSWPKPVQDAEANKSLSESIQDPALQSYFAARDHILSIMRAWIAWWGPIRERVLARYQEMDEENRTVIDALESLWRLGPEGADESDDERAR
jgi:hypothetical protein